MISYIACPECNGTGYIERERVAPWIDRDTPPDLVAYDEVCELCQGDGEIQNDVYGEDDDRQSDRKVSGANKQTL